MVGENFHQSLELEATTTDSTKFRYNHGNSKAAIQTRHLLSIYSMKAYTANTKPNFLY